MTKVILIDTNDRAIAETKINEALNENESLGFEAQVHNLSPQTNATPLQWRFVLLFTNNEAVPFTLPVE
jgi:hypothetical protein